MSNWSSIYCSQQIIIFSFESIKKNNAKRDYRYSFSPYYVPNIEIKDFNVLIDGRCFFDLPVKDDKEAHEKIIEMSKNNDHKPDNLLDFV